MHKIALERLRRMQNYIEPHDLRQRLNNTFLLYKGIPYYCNISNGESDDGEDTNTIMRLQPCDSSKNEERVDAYDSDVSIESIRLGYMNTRSDAYFLRRQPIRSYPHKKTIDRNYISCENSGGTAASLPNFVKSFEDMVLGKYPTYGEAYNKVSNSTSGRGYAFHIHFCIRGDKTLMYKNVEIGKCVSRESVQLSDDNDRFLYKRFLKKFDLEVV